jgi:Xaa-Pro aminopeptidase
MNKLIQEKTKQAVSILQEFDIDLWITFARETTAGGDPVLPLIYGHDLTWQSAVIISKTGKRIAIVGFFEENTATRTNAFEQVIPYNQSIKPALLEVLDEFKPASIALNYSQDDVYSDGLSYGLYQVLLDYLKDRPEYTKNILSAEKIISALRGRKTDTELRKIVDAIKTTNDIYDHTMRSVSAGMSEAQIAALMHQQVTKLGLTTSWEWEHCPTVNAGPDSPVGHVQPTNIKLEPGHLLHFDFGVKQNEYCSDIQRLAFLPSAEQPEPPAEMQRAFSTVVQAIQNSASAIKPGVLGKDIDAIARTTITEAGYPEFKHATGHQVGRQAHDGGAIIGPEWERYGNTPNWPLEEDQIYTIEPSIIHPEFGVIALEEMVRVTEHGCEFLSTPQTEFIILES